jgi:hypothetical protein
MLKIFEVYLLFRSCNVKFFVNHILFLPLATNERVVMKVLPLTSENNGGKDILEKRKS